MKSKTSKDPVVVYAATGASRVLGYSDARAPQLFKAGVIPTEFLVNGKTPGVSKATLTKLAPMIGAGRKSRN